jgi:hypothetical protein
MAFQLPAHVPGCRPKLTHWADLISSGRADSFKEQEILPDFLTDFFCGLLAYTRPADGGDRYTISRERLVEVNGKFADAVLGDFRDGKTQFTVALEGKGPKDPLDRPFAGRRVSAVDQGYHYAINLPCDWIIVTSIRQTRLYFKGADQYTYERFDTEKLATDDNLLKKFIFLLAAERVVPLVGRCHLYGLQAASDKAGHELTKQFYIQYANMRQDAFARLHNKNPDIPPHDVLRSAQKLLDRVLFCAFCEKRGLLPPDTISKAYEHRDPYRPRPIWDNFQGLFHAINEGNSALNIPAYNGGLFADDPVLDRIHVPDEVCGYFHDLGEYDYRPAHEAAADTEGGSTQTLIDVDILGHIFEQSITDLEKIRNELDRIAEPVSLEEHKSRRKKEGAFYTPSFITRYNVQQALGGVLKDRFEQLRQRHAAATKGTARSVLADPNVYDLDKLNAPQRNALVRFWEAWQDELATIRLLDPACGSGAFLIQSFDQLHAAYEASNDRLFELRGHRTLFDLDRQILQNNLYGVDLNEEAIEICKLSLWIKTAQRGKILTSLDHTIRVGNSVVSDPAIDPAAFDWQAAFPEVFATGGFDVVVANPPYVRQELLSPIKPYLKANYKTYHGMADLYVYFYELGLRLLKPGGLLCFVVTNKWMKSSYGEPLRRHFAKQAWVESVVDFGHAKQIFADADVFPSIIVARRPDKRPKPTTTRLCAIPREQLRIDDLSRQIEQEGVELPLSQLGTDAWQLESVEVTKLLGKIRQNGMPLAEYAGAKPLMGIKTGFNDAFLIETTTKNNLVAKDTRCAEIIKPYMRGQDITRWSPDWAGLWMIAIKSSENRDWPWSNSGEDAEAVFEKTYPAIYEHMKPCEAALRKRQDQGRFWWELRSCAYWEAFDQPKVMYQDITWNPRFCLDRQGTLSNNTVYFLPTADPWLFGVLNSPIAWWFSWRAAVHGKDEALRFFTVFLEQFPIPKPTDYQERASAQVISRLVEISNSQQRVRRTVLDWLRVEYAIEKPTKKMEALLEMDSDALVAEVKKIRGKKKLLTATALQNLREEHSRSIEPARALAAEAVTLENEISLLVSEAYGLTPEEVALMWDTAPPRMPISSPT